MKKDKNKSLLIAIPSASAIGGVEREVKIHATKFREIFSRIIIAIITFGGKKPEIDIPASEIHHIRLLPLPKTPFSIFHRAKLLHRFKEDILHQKIDMVLCYSAPITSYIVKLFSELKIPIVSVVVGNYKYRFRKMASLYYRKMIAESTRTIFVSENLRADFFRYHHIPESYIDKTSVIYSPIDTDNFSPPKYQTESTEKNIVAVGRLSSGKNFDLCIKAFAMVSRKYSDVNLLLIGDGPERKNLEKLAHSLGIDNRVKFLGFVDNIAPILCRSYMLVHTARYEGFGRVIAESLSCGVPVVTSSKGGPEEILANNVGGYLVEPNPEKIAEKIIYLLENPEIRIKLGELGRKRAVENYSISVFEEKMKKIYKLALEK